MNLKALHKVSYGMYIITSINEEKLNGQIANTVFQITSVPPTIAISINKQNLTHEYIKASKKFAVSVLSIYTDMKLIGNFGFKSGRDINKFEFVKYKKSKLNLPIILDSTIAYLEAEVINSIDVGTHTIFIGKITDAEILSDDKPMTYEYYHLIKKGRSPKTAPTFIQLHLDENLNKIEKKEVKTMKKYQCKVCGYIYDPEKGDPDSGIKPGTAFEDIPDDWTCPICGVSKEDFEPME